MALRDRLAGTALIVVGACSSANLGPPILVSEATLGARDTAVLTAVIRSLQQQREVPTSGVPIIVDPRPLLHEGGFPLITSEVFAAIPAKILASRATALRSIGIYPGDAAAPQKNCGGTLVPYPPPGEPNLKEGCPRRRVIAVAVSLPYPGSAKLPPGEPYDRINLQAAEGYWTVRVASAIVDVGGKTIQYYDVVMRKDGTRWLYVTHLRLLISE